MARAWTILFVLLLIAVVGSQSLAPKPSSSSNSASTGATGVSSISGISSIVTSTSTSSDSGDEVSSSTGRAISSSAISGSSSLTRSTVSSSGQSSSSSSPLSSSGRAIVSSSSSSTSRPSSSTGRSITVSSSSTRLSSTSQLSSARVSSSTIASRSSSSIGRNSSSSSAIIRQTSSSSARASSSTGRDIVSSSSSSTSKSSSSSSSPVPLRSSIVRVSGCADVGNVTVECSLTRSFLLTIFAADIGSSSTLSLNIRDSNNTRNDYQICPSPRGKLVGALMHYACAFYPTLYPSLNTASQYEINLSFRDGVIITKHMAIKFSANVSQPVITSVSGCESAGSSRRYATRNCVVGQSLITVTGAMFRKDYHQHILINDSLLCISVAEQVLDPLSIICMVIDNGALVYGQWMPIVVGYEDGPVSAPLMNAISFKSLAVPSSTGTNSNKRSSTGTNTAPTPSSEMSSDVEIMVVLFAVLVGLSVIFALVMVIRRCVKHHQLALSLRRSSHEIHLGLLANDGNNDGQPYRPALAAVNLARPKSPANDSELNQPLMLSQSQPQSPSQLQSVEGQPAQPVVYSQPMPVQPVDMYASPYHPSYQALPMPVTHAFDPLCAMAPDGVESLSARPRSWWHAPS